LLTVGTTFSGIGAPEQAFKNLGLLYKVKWACDINKHAKKTWLANHECDIFYEDVTKLNMGTLEYVDIYIFGFPCQSYSSNGGRAGLEDHRGKLIYNSLEILKVKQPKYFIAENVEGLLTHDNGKTFQIILKAMVSQGYKVYWKLLNSKHFGVPQSRKRVYIVGIHNTIIRNFSFDMYTDGIKNIKDILETNIPHEYLLNERGIKHCMTTSFMSDRCYYDPMTAPCLRLNADYFCFNGVYRHLTTIEMKRLQGFPDEFKMPVSINQQVKQLGNSMTVNVIQSVLNNLIGYKT